MLLLLEHLKDIYSVKLNGAVANLSFEICVEFILIFHIFMLSANFIDDFEIKVTAWNFLNMEFFWP